MVIIRDNSGNIIGKEASGGYTPTRKLRAAHEQRLCDAQMGIVRDETPTRQDVPHAINYKRVQAGQEPIYNDPGVNYGREDEACCGD